MAEALNESRDRETVAASAREGITLRALCVGLAVVLWIVFWNTHSEYIAHTSRMNISHFPMVLFCTFVLTGFLTLIYGIV